MDIERATNEILNKIIPDKNKVDLVSIGPPEPFYQIGNKFFGSVKVFELYPEESFTFGSIEEVKYCKKVMGILRDNFPFASRELYCPCDISKVLDINIEEDSIYFLDTVNLSDLSRLKYNLCVRNRWLNGLVIFNVDNNRCPNKHKEYARVFLQNPKELGLIKYKARGQLKKERLLAFYTNSNSIYDKINYEKNNQ